MHQDMICMVNYLYCFFSGFVNLSKVIALTKDQKKDGASPEHLCPYFPSFLWLLRDCTLKFVDRVTNEPYTAKDYLLQNILKANMKNQAEAGSSKANLKRALLTYFPTLDCRDLPLPSGDDDVIQNMHIATNYESLNAKFTQKEAKLISHLKEVVTCKKHPTMGNPITGPVLAEMVKEYLKVINNPNTLPYIEDTWKVAMQNQCNKVKQRLIEEYEFDMHGKISEEYEYWSCPLEEEITNDTPSFGRRCANSLMGLHRQVLHEKKALFNKM